MPDPSVALGHARATVVVADESNQTGVLVATGADRRSWLNGLVTSDLTKLAPGVLQYGLAVSPKGRILADLVFFEDGDRILALVPKAEAGSLQKTFDRYLVMEDAQIEASTDGFAIFSVHGPLADRVLETVQGEPDIVVVRGDRLGLGGGVVACARARGPAVAEVLSVAARAAGGSFATEEVMEQLRVEQAVPRFGADFGPSTYPQEAGLETRAVSFDKGCYLGQEVVCMLQLRGHVKRKLVPLVVEGSLLSGAALTAPDGREAGEVTSVVAGATPGSPSALAMVKLAFAEPGTELRAGESVARVHTKAV